MSDLDPDAVQVVAQVLHLTDCPPRLVPESRRHHEDHERYAKQLLAGLRNAGYTLTSAKEA